MNRRIKHILIPSILLANLTGCKPSLITNSEQPTEEIISTIKVGNHEKSSLAMGVEKDAKSHYGQGAGLVYDKDAEDFANNILSELKSSSPIKNIPGNVFFTADNAFNFKASADGNIYLSYGSLKRLNSADELAAIIAHELSHIILRHHDSDSYKKYQRRAIYIKGVISQLQRALKSKPAEPLLSENDKEQIKAIQQMILLTESVVFPTWQRQQEYDADRLAFDLLNKSGYSYNAFNGVFDTLIELEKKRLKNEKEKEAEQLKQTKGIMNKISLGFQTGRNKLLTLFSNNHPTPSGRKDTYTRYYNNYDIELLRTPVNFKKNQSRWEQLISRPIVEKLIKSFEYASLAKTHIEKGELAAAEKLTGEMESALGGDQNFMSYQPYSRLLRANLRKSQHRKKSASFNLDLATKHPYTPFKVYIEQGDIKGWNKARFNNTLKIFKAYGKPPSHYPKLITIARDLKYDKIAKKLKNDCELKHYGNGVPCTPESRDKPLDLSFSEFMKRLSSQSAISDKDLKKAKDKLEEAQK